MGKYTKGPSIYVASLAAYNEGRNKGAWVDISGMDKDDILAAIKKVVKKGEWAIHDYEGFGTLRLDEHESPAALAELVECIDEYGEGATAAFAQYAGMPQSSSFFKSGSFASAFQDAYHGEWDSEEAFVEDFLSDTGQLDTIPEWAQPYFDIEAYTRDLFSGVYWSADAGGGKVYVFGAQ